MWFPIPTIWIAQGMSATAAGADRLGGHLVEEATRAQVDGAEDRPPPPAGDLPDASTQRALAEGGSAKPLPQPADRPGLGLVQQPQDALVQAGAAQRWPASSGPVAQPAGAVGVVAVDPRRTVPGSQPNSSAMAAADRPWWDSRIMTRRKAVRCGRWSRLSRWQGQAAGQEGLASTLGGRILQAASLGRLCCGRLQRPARLLHLVGPHRRLRAEPLTIRLGCSSSPGLRVGAAQWGCTTAPAPATATPQVAAGRGSGPFPQRVGDRTDAGGRDLAEHQGGQ